MMLTTKTIGNKISEARKRVNISQAQLAQRLFISPQAVGKWERGESMPDILAFNRLAEILGVDLNYFSESFYSDHTGAAVVPSMDAHPGEMPSGAIPKRLPWDMSRGNWVDADFSGLKDLHEKFSSSNMQRCKFKGSDLSGLLLKGNNVDGCDFTGTDLSGSQLQGSHFVNNKFVNCSLREAGFSGSHIKGCDLSGADFSGATIKSSSLVKNEVADAVWNRTSFIGTHLSDIQFDGHIDDCYFEDCSFTRVTFRNALLLNTFFKNKSLKRIHFIDCQADRMTYEFLKNGKAELTGIVLIGD
jgi:uncharacterized protein YjbI with pentapeptide repeats